MLNDYQLSEYHYRVILIELKIFYIRGLTDSHLDSKAEHPKAILIKLKKIL